MSEITILNPSAPVEKRAQSRKRVFMGGVVVYEEGLCSFACTIRNMTEAGARIAIPRWQVFPAIVYLISIKTERAYAARVAWVGEREAGLTFIDSFDLKDVRPDIAHLRKIWNAHSLQ